MSRVDVGVITDRMKRIRAKGISASVGARDHVFDLGLPRWEFPGLFYRLGLGHAEELSWPVMRKHKHSLVR